MHGVNDVRARALRSRDGVARVFVLPMTANEHVALVFYEWLGICRP